LLYLIERKPGFAFPYGYYVLGAVSSTDSGSQRGPKFTKEKDLIALLVFIVPPIFSLFLFEEIIRKNKNNNV
jgi:hypothetical protein